MIWTPETVCNAIYAGSALLGALTALISAVQGFRKPRKAHSSADKALERLSILPMGVFRNGNGKN
jgi:hypothetical protein